ncbi:permease [Phycicoccus sp. CSK15P-2]|uniref:permease n=1 Tax=Phycicoccus sp. CSK15P-2 TaxID=2807627 RepID=UPI001950D82E|nr:permease [Phycicoccus sp. CSK15P-2]MBM6405937.1 permease [Phycicoccus sp. CSK15P-2]
MLGELWWFVTFTAQAVLELLPWFLVAIVLGVLIQHLDLDMLAKRALSRHGVLGVLLSAAVGALSPFCSFTVIPLISRLLRAGVPLSVIMAFWIASPAMDPEIFALSAAALGPDVATARLVGAIVLSVGSALVVLAVERRGGFRDVLVRERPSRTAEPAPDRVAASVAVTVPQGGPATPVAPVAGPAPASGPVADEVSGAACSATCGGDTAESPWDDDDDGCAWQEVVRANARTIDWRRFARDVGRDLTGLGRWLLLAVVAQGVIVRYVPQEWVTTAIGSSDWWAVPLAALVGVPLYLNGVGAIPITQGLLTQGMMPGAAVTFLLAGAITTVPAMVAVRSVVRWRVFAYYVGVGLVGSILIGVAAQPWL